MERNSGSQRSFTMRDALILVAAAAIPIWLTRIYLAVVSQLFPMFGRTDRGRLTIACSPMLIPVHLGVLILQVIPPRPHRSRLAQQPGFVAGVALVTMVLLQTAVSAYQWVAVPASYRGPDPSSVWPNKYLQSLSPSEIAPAVILAWVMLGLQGYRWKSADWVESFGRLFGLVWIVAWVGFLILLAYW